MKTAKEALPNELLSYEREQRHWTQDEVAEYIGAPNGKMVGKWERGIIVPAPHYRQKLATIFGKSTRSLGFPLHKEEIPFWNVPYRQNLFFTGRDYLFQHLHNTLSFAKRAALIPPQALNGLGGVGKTQMAIEYAYRYKHEYHTIAWVQAYSREVLEADFAALASLLQLPTKDGQDQRETIQTVRQWFSTLTQWLLVFDNADDLSLLEDFLPSPARGHILLTTRTRATGTIAQAVEIETMEPDEGAYFLLRRAKVIAPDVAPDAIEAKDLAIAKAISETLGGLPLALDQAGAYIEETACGLSNYLKLYQAHREVFLRRRGTHTEEHPEPVATTWSLAFEKLRQKHSAAIELLYLLAFCDPDSTPEEVLTLGAPDLSPTLSLVASDALQLNKVIAELRKYSLIDRNPETNTLTLHRLVQAVLQAEMDEQVQRMYAEQVVRATNRVFPGGDYETWQQCERLLPQALLCAEHIEHWHLMLPEAAQLLRRLGRYRQERGNFAQLEQLYQQALMISEQTLGPEHLETAKILNNQGELYFYLCKPAQAEPIFQRALAIREQALPLDHLDIAESLYQLGMIAIDLDKHVQAEQFLQKSLHIRQQLFGTEHVSLVFCLNELGFLCLQQEKYAQAEELFQQAVIIYEKNGIEENHEIGICLINLARAYRDQGKYEQAKPLYLKALALWEDLLGPEHPNSAYGLQGLAKLYALQENYMQAKILYQQALTIFEKTLGSHAPKVITLQNEIAQIEQLKENESKLIF